MVTKVTRTSKSTHSGQESEMLDSLFDDDFYLLDSERICPFDSNLQPQDAVLGSLLLGNPMLHKMFRYYGCYVPLI